jgi:hypothetical protein
MRRIPILIAASLCLAVWPTLVSAQEPTLWPEFQSICLENLADLSRGEESARHQGFFESGAPTGALPGKAVSLTKSIGGARFIFVGSLNGSPPQAIPQVIGTGCTLTFNREDSAGEAQFIKWIGVPERNRGEDRVSFSFRIENERHVPVGNTAAAFAESIEKGGHYIVQIRRTSAYTAFAIVFLEAAP